jgi:predicted metal-dependent peptidase
VALGHVPPDANDVKLNAMRKNVAQDLVINEHFQGYRHTAIAQSGVWLDKFPKLPKDIAGHDWRALYAMLGEDDGGQGFDSHDFGSAGEEGEDGDGVANAELAAVQAEEIARQAARHCKLRGLDSAIPLQIKVALERPKKTHMQLVREILQRFVASSRDTKKRLTWRRVSRRLGHVARGRLSARLPRVAVAIDSSGSMVDDKTLALLSEVVAAVCAVAETVEAVVGDTEVRATGVLTASNVARVLPDIMRGGGGTTLQPLLTHLAQSGRYDAVLLLTDGACDVLSAHQPTCGVIVPGGHDAPGLAMNVHLTGAT